MFVVVWVASAMVAASVPVALWALTGDRASARLTSQNLAGTVPTMRQTELQRSPVERMVLPVMRSIGAGLVRFTPIGWVEGRTVALARAGLTGRVTAEQILGIKLVLVVAVIPIVVLRLLGGGSVRAALLLATLAVVGFFLPDLLVRASGDRRVEAIVGALPDLLDQVTISVEAGLGFEAALARYCRDRTHPLAREVVRMLQDIRLGSSRGEALGGLVERAQVDEVKSVVLSLRQADSLGVPLAETLRVASNDMREKRRYRAEERAQRLPTLMIFPLGLCIMPALFIIVLGPAMIGGRGL